jgi:nardilysin
LNPVKYRVKKKHFFLFKNIAEFQIALPSDTFRKEQLLVSFAKTDTPVNTFTWGNLITLRDNVSEDELYAGVHEFRKRHYSAHRMTLTIQVFLLLEYVHNPRLLILG